MIKDENSKEDILCEALNLFKKARLADKKKCVQEIIKIIDEKKGYTFIEPKKNSKGFFEFGYYSYNERLYDIMEIIQPDFDYLKNFKKIKDKEITTLTMKELETYITRIIRGEKFIDGLIASCIDDGTLKNLLERFLELYKENEFNEIKKTEEKASLRKTILDENGNEFEVEEKLENIDSPDDINSLKNALNKSCDSKKDNIK